MMTVFITKRKRPRVMTVIGNDNISNIGFNTALRIPSTIATMIAVPKLFTDIPGSSHAVK